MKHSMTEEVIYARKKAATAAAPAKPREPDRAPAPLNTGVEEGAAVAELTGATLETWGAPEEPPTGEEAVGTTTVDQEVTAAQVVWTTGTTVTEGPAGTGAAEVVATGAGALEAEELPTGETPPAGTEVTTAGAELPVAPTPVERAGQSVTVGAQEVMVTSSVW